MSDIRKRTGAKGVSYQVRFPCTSKKSGYSFKSFKTMKEAKLFAASCEVEGSHRGVSKGKLSVSDAVALWLNICEKIGRDGREVVEPQTLVEYERRAKVIDEYPWRKRISELLPVDVIDFRSWLLENKSRDLARRVLSSFHSVILEMMDFPGFTRRLLASQNTALQT